MRAKARSKYITEILNVLSNDSIKDLTEKEQKSFGVEDTKSYFASRLEDVRIDKLEKIVEEVHKGNYSGKSAAQVLKAWGEKDLLVIDPEIREVSGVKSIFVFYNSFLQFKKDRFVVVNKAGRTKSMILIEDMDSEDSVLAKIKVIEAFLELLKVYQNDLDLSGDPYKELAYDFLVKTVYVENSKLEVSYKVFNALVEAYN
jgi:hypothetical protein